MSTLDRILGSIPYVILVPAALLLALAPFGATPHLVEKWRMLAGGTLRKPLDWFDLVMHTTPLLLLIIKIAVDTPRWLRK